MQNPNMQNPNVVGQKAPGAPVPNQEKKKGSKKKKGIIILLVVVLLVLGAYAWKRGHLGGVVPGSSEPKKPIVSESTPKAKAEAIETAEKFLKKQEYADQYEPNAVKAENFKEFWSVWFDKKDQNARPNKGLIQVSKETGEPEWKELY